MSESSANWSLQTWPFEERTCPCCGDPFALSSGAVYDEQGDEFALYMAKLMEHGGVREVHLLIKLVGTDKQERELEKEFVSLVLWKHGNGIETSVATEEGELLGHVMTEEEALASPFLPLVFEIDDFIVVNDPHIAPFLEEDGEGQSWEGE
jgi:hypothetical protein